MTAYLVLSCLLVLFLLGEVPHKGAASLRSLQQQGYTKSTKEGSIHFADIDIAYKLYDLQPANPGPVDIPTAVFLHGMKFNKETWETLGTLQKVQDAGMRALAIDLPGYGKTRALPYSDNNMRAELLHAVLTFAQTKVNSTLHLITPSMSGRYAVPFLDRHGTLVTSWVAIAPVGVVDWGGPWEDTHMKVCMLALYGEKDVLLSDSEKLVRLFKHSYPVTIPGAGHACYMDAPDFFQKVLLKFLTKCHRDDKGAHVLKPDREVSMQVSEL